MNNRQLILDVATDALQTEADAAAPVPIFPRR